MTTRAKARRATKAIERTALAAVAVTVAVVLPAATARAQVQPLEQRDVEIAVDSGLVVNAGPKRGVIFSTVIEAADATWIRVRFDEARLGLPSTGDEPTVLRVTSLLDDAVQTLDQVALDRWQGTSAYFNGDAVLLEIVADPGAMPSRTRISSVWAGAAAAGGAATSICGATDDRLLSEDPRVGRVVPIGCTVWLIDDANHCFLTAGHCANSSLDVVEFNVPLSTSEGAIQHPGPDDQYPVDPASLQTNGGGGIGNDWAYFGCFPNTAGRTAYERQGSYFVLASAAPSGSGQTIEVTGYGTTSSPVPPEWNSAQKTHTGPYAGVAGTNIQYTVDTTGGNSGSPVVDLFTGLAVGIHTHAGCDANGGANNGTAIELPALQVALANPRGVCIPSPPVAFSYPEGLPEALHPNGDTIRVEVAAANGGSPAPGTGMLHYDDGSGFVVVAMEEIEPNLYDAFFPPLPCGAVVRFYFSAEADDAEIVSDPFSAPSTSFESFAAAEVIVVLEDDMEVGAGWDIESIDLTDGGWDRGVPAGAGDRGDPLTDFDGSGACFLTDNSAGNSDVDGGPTRLTSPRIDLSGEDDPRISYARWFTNDDGDIDRLDVEVSADDGANWMLVESVGHGPGWQVAMFRVADFVTPTDQVRVRFSATDNPNDSITEAAVDALRVLSFECGDPLGDVDGDGDVDFEDLLQVLAQWGECPPKSPCPTDLDGNGSTGFGDLLILLANWSLAG